MRIARNTKTMTTNMDLTAVTQPFSTVIMSIICTMVICTIRTATIVMIMDRSHWWLARSDGASPKGKATQPSCPALGRGRLGKPQTSLDIHLGRGVTSQPQAWSRQVAQTEI